ncbi:hypothetical protein [Alicyclobacillus fastidiosus]
MEDFMNRFRVITSATLVLSLIGNGWLGFHIYKNSSVLQMQTASYNSFKTFLSEAVKATDAERHDKPGSTALASDAIQANTDLERAIGTIWGLRTDFAKKGMDIYPIFLVLVESENFSPYEPNFYSKETQKFINENSKRLHDVESALAPTSFTNTGLNQLQKAVSSF